MFDDDDDLFDFDDELQLEDDSTLEPKAALKMIANLYKLPNIGADRRLHDILFMIDNDLPNLMGHMSMQDEQLRKLYNQLHTLSAKVVEQFRLPVLSGKTVIGVGGMFSAGKSSFLNALTGVELLPDNQEKCTAIATYMVSGEKESITAYTMKDQAIPLSPEELQAVSHQFYDDYGMGFSNIIRKMIMTLPKFHWPDIVLLDTPGYNSELDNDDVANLLSDEKVAREHLSSCDYLIWLVDIENGVIPPSDINFIKKLPLVNKPLFVLNKADKKNASELQEVLKKCKKQLSDEQIANAGITAFSSQLNGGEEYLEESYLKEYLKNASKRKHSDVGSELTWLMKEWQDIMAGKLKEYDDEIRSLESGILLSENPRYITSLLYSYRLVLQQSTDTYRQTQRLDKLGQNLLSKLSNLR
jgi:ribosome biogenesis GTPase A